METYVAWVYGSDGVPFVVEVKEEWEFDENAPVESAPQTPPEKPMVVTPGETITALATLPESAVLDMGALARVLHRSKKAVQRAVRRGELPQPFRFLGKATWVVKVIIEHFEKQQEQALKQLAHHQNHHREGLS